MTNPLPSIGHQRLRSIHTTQLLPLMRADHLVRWIRANIMTIYWPCALNTDVIFCLRRTKLMSFSLAGLLEKTVIGYMNPRRCYMQIPQNPIGNYISNSRNSILNMFNRRGDTKIGKKVLGNCSNSVWAGEGTLFLYISPYLSYLHSLLLSTCVICLTYPFDFD